MFLGLDASTQSLSATIIDPVSSAILAADSVNFGADLPHYNAPSGFIPGGVDGEVHADPAMWLDALNLLMSRLQTSGIELAKIIAISGAGQQHASIYLTDEFHQALSNLDPEITLAEQIRPTLSRASSPIWMDHSTSLECREITDVVPDILAVSGSVATTRFTGPQIRKFYKSDPLAYQNTHLIHLASSFLSSVIAGKSSSIDIGDGAGMNLMNLATADWHPALLVATAPLLSGKLPAIEKTGSFISEISPYFVKKYGFSPRCKALSWTGDNPASLVGMGVAASGEMVISLGTSDTIFASIAEPLTDPDGYGHVFGNPMGGFMSLTCFTNGSLARERLKNDNNLSWEDFEDHSIQQISLGNDGKIAAPFYISESTPEIRSHQVHTNGWDFQSAPIPVKIRALLEGQFMNMRLHSKWLGSPSPEILLTGGASKNSGIAQTIANVFNRPTKSLTNNNKTASSASLGAAIIAAVSHGHDCNELSKNFCKPDPQATDPQPDSSIYDILLPNFATLIDHLKSQS